MKLIIFLCLKGYPLFIILIFADTGYWSNLSYCIISFVCRKYQNSVKNTISVKNCIKYYVPNLHKRFIFTREKNIGTMPDSHASFFIRTILYDIILHNFIKCKFYFSYVIFDWLYWKWAIKQVFFPFWLPVVSLLRLLVNYRSLLYYGKFFKKSEKTN